MSRKLTCKAAICVLFLVSNTVYSETPKSARNLYYEGMKALSIDNPYSAIDSFRNALRTNPAYVEARLGMAEALFQLSEYEVAAEEIEQARPFAGGRRDLRLLDARIQTALGHFDLAADIYRELIAIRPHDAQANSGLAELYAITGQQELAENAFYRSLQYSPGDRRAMLQLVLLHDKSRDKSSSDRIIQQALKLFPDNFTVRIVAIEHFALYEEWESVVEHLDKAKSMVGESDNERYSLLGLIDAEIALRNGDPAAAIGALERLPNLDTTKALYLLARAYRDLSMENEAQDTLSHLLMIRSDDEIARMFKESYLMFNAGGFKEQRIESASWHLDRGKAYEEGFFYNRAYHEYRRARLIDKYNPDAWMGYLNILGKMGYAEHYSDSLGVALMDIPQSNPEYSMLKDKLDSYRHSEKDGLAVKWGINDPWILPSAEWEVAVYVMPSGNSLPIHSGAQTTLGLYFADLLDLHPDIEVSADASGRNPTLKMTGDFSQAFKESRDSNLDYFVILRFFETERTFSASANLYIARTGELYKQFNELRTGQDRVTDSLHQLSNTLNASIPRLMRIEQVNGEYVLMNKGSWHGIATRDLWIVLRSGSGLPSTGEGGITYGRDDFLGTVEISEVSEPLSEGIFEREGDFDFIGPGDELFQLPVPETETEDYFTPDPAFRAQLLAIP
ncbi:hypothetical protein JY97_12085 [Alkalispirochaeta odontotermitis]|nr:hypothetical protein JY97_12085 [Alkalispirochaeta odontotermitis]